jgi:ubiquitin-protein ligase
MDGHLPALIKLKSETVYSNGFGVLEIESNLRFPAFPPKLIP